MKRRSQYYSVVKIHSSVKIIMINHTSVPAITPLHKIDEIRCWENRPFTRIWPEPQSKKSKGITRTIRKKHRKARTTFTLQQLQMLERTYTSNKYLDTELRQDLAKSLNIEEKCIKVWFQNRRMKEKRESSEANSDSSSYIPDAGNSQHETQYVINQHVHNSQQHYSLGTNQDYMQNYSFLSTQTVLDNNIAYNYDYSGYPTQYYPNYCVESSATNQFNIPVSETQSYWSENDINGYVYI